MTLADKMRLYRMFLEQGSFCLCTHCGEKGYCASNVMDMSTECFKCALKRIEREEQEHLAGLDKPSPKTKPEPLKNFNYEDFIKL